MKNHLNIFLAFVIFITFSCGNKSSNIKPDIDANKAVFKKITGEFPSKDVNNLYVHSKNQSGTKTITLAFNCDPETIDAINANLKLEPIEGEETFIRKPYYYWIVEFPNLHNEKEYAFMHWMRLSFADPKPPFVIQTDTYYDVRKRQAFLICAKWKEKD